ncbi:MAG TPA: hypothetical protein PKK11_02670 [Methanothrix sp.]|nr:hypothetical protein [Methanothrix sp.]HPT19158.1 hypothetical protein [Methanothrix sp.]
MSGWTESRVDLHLLCQHLLQSSLPLLGIRLFLSAGKSLLGIGIALELASNQPGEVACRPPAQPLPCLPCQGLCAFRG